MAAQEDAARNLSPQCFYSTPESLLVTFRTNSRRRSVWPQLTKQQLAAENCESGFAEAIRDCDEQRRVAVRSGTVREDYAVPWRTCGDVKIAANGNFARLHILERPAVGFHHRLCRGSTRTPVSSHKGESGERRLSLIAEAIAKVEPADGRQRRVLNSLLIAKPFEAFVDVR